jgi:hypothetical protein
MPRKKARKKSKRVVSSVSPPPLKEWWEEDWAIPVLGLFAVAGYIVIRDMHAQGLVQQAKQGQKGVVRG